MASENGLILFSIGVAAYFFFNKKTQPSAPSLPSSQIPSPSSNRMTTGSGTAYAKWVQNSLNQLLGCGLQVDGIIGTQSVNCIKRFQQTWGLTVDGIVGPETDYAIKSALGTPGYTDQPYGQSINDKWY